MEYFDFVDSIFDNNKWKSVTDSDKKKNYFQFMRLVSIVWPVVAQTFNKNRINESAVIDCVREEIVRRFGNRKAPWVYTKKEVSEKNLAYEKLKKYDKDIILSYIMKYELSSEDFIFKLNNHTEITLSEIDKMDKFAKSKSDK